MPEHYLKRELYELIKTDPSVFDFLQRGSTDGMWYWDLEKPEHEWMNERFWTTLGYDPGDKPHLAEAWQDIINQEDLQLAIENFKRHCQDPEHPYDQTVRYRHSDGSTVWIRCRGIAVRDPNGKPFRMLGVHSDVTNIRKSFQREKEQRQAYLESMIGASHCGTLVISPKGKVLLANERAAHWLDADFEDLKGAVFFDLLPELDWRPSEPADDSQASKSEIQQTTLKRKDGTVMYFEVGFGHHASDDSIIIVTLVNVTEREVAAKRLKAANAELEEFAYRTSHDLRSPLVSSYSLIALALKLMPKEGLADARESLELAASSIKTLETLVEDIMSLAKVGYATEEPQVLDVEEQVCLAVSKLSHIPGADRVQVKTKFDHEGEVICQKSRFSLILENLISNAFKYHDRKNPDPVVKTHSYTENGQFHLQVSDNGLGIPEQYRKDVFGMFKRFHPKASFGSGLGLYMTLKSALFLGGTLKYRPEQPGSTFVLALPSDEKEPEDPVP